MTTVMNTHVSTRINLLVLLKREINHQKIIQKKKEIYTSASFDTYIGI